jgi:hypothetical protein
MSWLLDAAEAAAIAARDAAQAAADAAADAATAAADAASAAAEASVGAIERGGSSFREASLSRGRWGDDEGGAADATATPAGGAKQPGRSVTPPRKAASLDDDAPLPAIAEEAGGAPRVGAADERLETKEESPADEEARLEAGLLQQFEDAVRAKDKEARLEAELLDKFNKAVGDKNQKERIRGQWRKQAAKAKVAHEVAEKRRGSLKGASIVAPRDATNADEVGDHIEVQSQTEAELLQQAARLKEQREKNEAEADLMAKHQKALDDKSKREGEQGFLNAAAKSKAAREQAQAEAAILQDMARLKADRERIEEETLILQVWP